MESLAPESTHLAPEAVLHRIFGHAGFRGRQAEIVQHVMEGGSGLVLMPTGGGKSLCFQVPALCRPGLGVVVSPLIALMEDQVAALRQQGVAAAALHSDLPEEQAREVRRDLARGAIKLLYVSPERLSSTPPWRGWRNGPSPSSPSTRRIASASGATTSGRNTAASACWPNASPRCRASP
ncbi:DEAD/DEAH box helicase [Siccirubricoccus deserti]